MNVQNWVEAMLLGLRVERSYRTTSTRGWGGAIGWRGVPRGWGVERLWDAFAHQAAFPLQVQSDQHVHGPEGHAGAADS